jgi:hypothetical protein
MARESSYPKAPIVIAFATSNRSNAQTKLKVVRNRNIDELIDCDYIIPGISAKAVIKEVGMGEIFIERYKKKYGILILHYHANDYKRSSLNYRNLTIINFVGGECMTSKTNHLINENPCVIVF